MKSNLKKFRTAKKLSQAGLTRLTGISPSIISAIENEKLYCYPGWRKKFAEALEVPEADLFPEVSESCATSNE